MENRGFRRSNLLPNSLDRSIDNVKNSDHLVKRGKGTSSIRNDLWRKSHEELLEQQSLSPTKQAHSITEQTQKVADVAPQEALHKPHVFLSRSFALTPPLNICLSTQQYITQFI